jgi:pentatricopeptide repeat protein
MMKATEIFQYMQSKNQESATQNDPSVSCVMPDLITFSTLIKGHCRVKNIEQALILHEQMLQQGIKADEVLYNSLLDGCLKSDETEMALKCYKI